MKLSRAEKAAMDLDLYTKKKYNMNEEQFETYIERLGICLFDGLLKLGEAHKIALQEVGCIN
jgi:hypothetical protein